MVISEEVKQNKAIQKTWNYRGYELLDNGFLYNSTSAWLNTCITTINNVAINLSVMTGLKTEWVITSNHVLQKILHNTTQFQDLSYLKDKFNGCVGVISNKYPIYIDESLKGNVIMVGNDKVSASIIVENLY